jgi:hypothetical protein
MTQVRLSMRLSPPLVAELLALLVDVPGVDVVIDLSAGAVEAGTDILVTSRTESSPLPPAVVYLDQPIAPGVATVVDPGATDRVAVADLDAIAEVIRNLCASRA